MGIYIYISIFLQKFQLFIIQKSYHKDNIKHHWSRQKMYHLLQIEWILIISPMRKLEVLFIVGGELQIAINYLLFLFFI